MDMFLLHSQTAVITGGARGLGLSFAQTLANVGANIAVLDVIQPSEELFKLRQKYGVKVEFYKADVTDRETVYHLVEQIEREFGGIHINVNAAGVVTDEPFLTTSEKNIERTFAVNFKGSFLVAQACANSMVRRYQSRPHSSPRDPSTGSILFITSIATHIASTAQSISCYSASKAAVRGLVKPLAVELAPYGIRVNSLSPGYMMTDMMRGLQEQQPDLVRQFEKETMFGRIGDPRELQGAVVFLCSRASSWCTGQDLLIDGGASSWKHPGVLDTKENGN